jgi:hypothetical protein
MLRAEFRLPSVTDEEAAPERKAPIRVKFEIPYFTVSGIQVCYINMVFVYSKYYLAIFFSIEYNVYFLPCSCLI